MGLLTDEPGNSLDFSSSASGPSSLGMFMPPFDKASVSITPGPPACVTMAKFFSCGFAPLPVLLPSASQVSITLKMQPTVVSSSREKHLTMPAFLNKASTAASLDAMAPVCDDAARLPLSLEPALMAAMRHPLRMSELAWKSSLSGLPTFSMYSNFTFESVSGSKCSSIH